MSDLHEIFLQIRSPYNTRPNAHRRETISVRYMWAEVCEKRREETSRKSSSQTEAQEREQADCRKLCRLVDSRWKPTTAATTGRASPASTPHAPTSPPPPPSSSSAHRINQWDPTATARKFVRRQSHHARCHDLSINSNTRRKHVMVKNVFSSILYVMFHISLFIC